jgi:hypothetical protein
VKATAFDEHSSGLIGAVGSGGAHGGFGLGLNEVGRPFFTVYGAAGQAFCSSCVTLDAWNLVTITYNEESVVVFYIDGELQNISTYELATETTSGDIYVGSLFVPAWGGWVIRFHGSIDDARIYRDALSASEVQALYASYGFQGAGSAEPPPPPENVVVYTSYGWPSGGEVYALDADLNGVSLTLDGQTFVSASPELIAYLYNYDVNGGDVNYSALVNLISVITE